MQQILLPVPTQFAGQNQPSGLAEFSHPRAVAWPKLSFELLPKFLRQRWTLARCRNRNLKVTAPHHSGIKEIAVLRNIHHVAQHAAPLSLAINQFVQTARGGCAHCKKCPIEAAPNENPKV